MNTTQKEFIEKLNKCAAACDICLDACLDEENLDKMVACVRTDRDCARICRLTASFVASGSAFTDQLVGVCESICKSCADECAKHEADHCQECAEACRACEEACRDYANVAA